MSEVTAFSTEQQGAVFGHALLDPAIWYRLDILQATKEWFVDPKLSELFSHVEAFRARHKRPPTADELVNYVCNRENETFRKSVRANVDACLKWAAGMGLDVLMMKIQEWARSNILKRYTSALVDYHNKGDHDKANALAQEQAQALQRLDIVSGTADCFISSAERVKKERVERDAENAHLLHYGVTFLDDALIGIRPHDLIVIGARSGAGKTQLAKGIAEYNAKLGKRVSFFALEAEENEIERRIKYGLMAKEYLKTHEGAYISYADWLMGKLPDLEAYGDDAEAVFERDYKTLKTFYRVRGDFAIEDLDREIMRVHKDSDLIILDHIHYVDLDGDDENREMNRLMKKLRDLSIALGVPIIAVAHLKKASSKAAALVPDFNDYHGASGISKIATVGIMLAPGSGTVAAVDSRAVGTPTFVRIVKCRVGGDRLVNVAVMFYADEIGTYRDDYALGHLNFAETKWSPHKGLPPHWADPEHGGRCTVQDIGEGS